MKYLAQIFLFTMVMLFGALLGVAQTTSSPPPLAPNAPADNPQPVSADQVKKFEEAIKPYIEQAKKSYPEAKKRFLAGLPPKHNFYITTRLHDERGRFEQVFVAVTEIKDETVKGIIASDVTLLTNYKYGDKYSFPESELMDWTISKPDGSEEGNFVGKFLDNYQP